MLGGSLGIRTGGTIGSSERGGEVDAVLVVVCVLEGDGEVRVGSDLRWSDDAVQCRDSCSKGRENEGGSLGEGLHLGDLVIALS